MNALQVIEALSGICADMAHIISEQQKALAQLDAVVMEEEIADARSRYNALGHGEWPDEYQEEQTP